MRTVVNNVVNKYQPSPVIKIAVVAFLSCLLYDLMYYTVVYKGRGIHYADYFSFKVLLYYFTVFTAYAWIIHSAMNGVFNRLGYRMIETMTVVWVVLSIATYKYFMQVLVPIKLVVMFLITMAVLVLLHWLTHFSWFDAQPSSTHSQADDSKFERNALYYLMLSTAEPGRENTDPLIVTLQFTGTDADAVGQELWVFAVISGPAAYFDGELDAAQRFRFDAGMLKNVYTRSELLREMSTL